MLILFVLCHHFSFFKGLVFINSVNINYIVTNREIKELECYKSIAVIFNFQRIRSSNIM